MNEMMPKEQIEKINRIQNEMLRRTNMTENEAYHFAFRCWQCNLDFVKPKRTEQEILKDFEALGWELTTNDYYGFIFKNKRNEFLKIYNLSKTYRCECNLSMQEHKLLNELFTLWGWV